MIRGGRIRPARGRKRPEVQRERWAIERLASITPRARFMLTYGGRKVKVIKVSNHDVTWATSVGYAIAGALERECAGLPANDREEIGALLPELLR